MARLLLPCVLCGLAPASLSAADGADYLRDVKPILARHCFACHGATQQKAGLRLDTAANLKKGGRGGPGLIASQSAESLVYQAVTGTNGLTPMPYKRSPLAPDQIAILKNWIDQGAKAPEHEVVDVQLARRYQHWAFQAPVRPALPPVTDASWVRNPIDSFVLARLERERLAPSPEAARATLIRRLSLDLLGLPPSVWEVDQFVADVRPDAYEQLVDRLLASPHYGERWGRLWLDVARYADSNGYSIDGPREIWKYREWVIDAFNLDLPYDQFLIEQMAGDLAAAGPRPSALGPNQSPSTPAADSRIATGFHRNTPINQEGGIDREQFRIESVYDRVNTTGSAFLGLTLGCARCHDHKFDPITQREYFQLFAFLNNADEPNLDLATPTLVAKRDAIKNQLRVLEEEQNTYLLDKVKHLGDAERSQLKPEILSILNLGVEQRDEKQKQALVMYFKNDTALQERAATVAGLKKRLPKFPTTMVLRERAQPRRTFIHIQGDFTRPGDLVNPGVPGVLHRLPDEPRPNRLTLARWLVDPANPLLARVAVNRLWQGFFGKGLVETENDFGTQGQPPTHPELLDWFATELPARQWSQKAMHRLIVTSAAYRQSARVRPELAGKDPYNKLLARQARLRLDAELVRDGCLKASGLLNPTLGGRSVFPPQPEGVFRFTQLQKGWTASIGPDRYRRGLYTWFWRSAPHPALLVFDAPDGVNSCTRRNRSNTPLQALTLLNDEAFLEFSQALALRILREGPATDAERLVFAFRLCLARAPAPEEQARLDKFLAEQMASFRAKPDEARALVPAAATKHTDPAQLAAWTSLARVLLNLDEFITRE